MKSRLFLIRLLLVLCALFGTGGALHAATLVYQGQICWQNVSSYDQVVVHFQPNGNSDWDTNMTVNGVTIGSTGQGSNYAGQSGYVPGNSINLGWVKVGGCAGWVCASYSPSIDYGQCNPTFEDTGVSPNEGYFWFEGYKYVNPTLSVSKSASPNTLVKGDSGQYYSIYIGVSNGPTTAAISITDVLPAGFTTSGAITATGGSLSGCPSANATSLAGCTIASGTYGPITITVPVNIASTAASSATNYAYVYGGGDPNCAGGCVGGTTNPVIPASPKLSLSKALGPGGRVNGTDQFTVQILRGSTVVNATGSSTTTGTGSLVNGGTTGTFTATAGTTYTLTEVAASGNLVQYTSTVSCSNGAVGGTVVSGTTSLGRSITPVRGDVISCVLTNTPATFLLYGKVVLDNGAGSGVAHDAIQNGAEPALAGVTVNLTNCAGTVYSTGTSAADGSFSLNLTSVPANQAVCVVQTLSGSYTPVSASPGTATGVVTTTTSHSTTLKFTPAAYTSYSGVVLGNANASTLTSNGEQQTTPGAAVTYSHLYTAGSAGSVRFGTTENSSPAGVVWSSVIYRDTNCNGVLDGADTLLTAAVPVTAGQRICLLNRVITPAGAPAGMKDLTTVRATEDWSVPTLSPSSQSNVLENTDTTKVAGGGLTLLKEVRKLSANCPLDAKASVDDLTPYTLAGSTKPGDSLEYRLTYANNTASPMTAIKVNDSVPAFTQFKGALCLSWPKSISDCTVAQQPATDAATGSILWVLLDHSTSPIGLQPMDSGTVSFCVKVQQ